MVIDSDDCKGNFSELMIFQISSKGWGKSHRPKISDHGRFEVIQIIHQPIARRLKTPGLALQS